MIYMWKEENSQPFYRFQTDDKRTAEKMKRRKNFRLVGWGENCNLWIFVANISRRDTAKKVLKTLSGNVVKYDKNEEMFFASTDFPDSEKKAA